MVLGHWRNRGPIAVGWTLTVDFSCERPHARSSILKIKTPADKQRAISAFLQKQSSTAIMLMSIADEDSEPTPIRAEDLRFGRRKMAEKLN